MKYNIYKTIMMNDLNMNIPEKDIQDLKKKPKKNYKKIIIPIIYIIITIAIILLILKFKREKIYNEIIDELKKKKKSEKIKGIGNEVYKEGFENDYNNLIYKKSESIYQKQYRKYCYYSPYLKLNKKFQTNDIIVGFKIIPNEFDESDWVIKENPLLTYKISIDITSDYCKDINYEIILYTIKKPE